MDGERLGGLVAGNLQGACDFREHSLALRLASLEKLGNTRQTVRNVVASNAAGVERTHGELRARLANGLSGDNADCSANVHRTARGQVPTVALLAHAMLSVAGHDRADDDRVNASSLKRLELIHAE